MSEVLVTVLGMLAAFATAFFAEPVKLYFQNKSKLKHLRIALYKEMYFNYMLLRNISNKEKIKRPITKGRFDGFIDLATKELKSDYFNQAQQNELQAIYQLKEFIRIDSLYYLMRIFRENALRLADRNSSPKLMEFTLNTISDNTNKYLSSYMESFQDGILDKKLLKKIAYDKDYKEIISYDSSTHPPTSKDNSSTKQIKS